MTCCEIVISVLYVVFIVIVTSCSYVYYQYNRKVSTDGDLQVDTNITDEDMEEHNRNIDNLNKLTEKNTEWQNKFILTISSALFGLLFANLKILPSNSMLFYILVINNGLTLIGTLLSYSFAILGINKRKFFSLKYHIYHQFEYRNKETRCGKFAEYLNLLSIITTCLTIVYLAIILMTKK